MNLPEPVGWPMITVQLAMLVIIVGVAHGQGCWPTVKRALRTVKRTLCRVGIVALVFGASGYATTFVLNLVRSPSGFLTFWSTLDAESAEFLRKNPHSELTPLSGFVLLAGVTVCACVYLSFLLLGDLIRTLQQRPPTLALTLIERFGLGAALVGGAGVAGILTSSRLLGFF